MAKGLTFHWEVKTAEAERRMLMYIQAVPNELADAVQRVADDSVLIFQSHAPRGRTGALGRGIRAVSAQGRLASGRFATGRQFAIVANARRHGYDYVGVTRFGHRNLFIRPLASRAAQSVISTRKAKRTYGAGPPRPALRLAAGDPTFQYKVRGFKPAGDWAERAQAAVDRELDHQAERLTQRLVRRFG